MGYYDVSLQSLSEDVDSRLPRNCARVK